MCSLLESQMSNDHQIALALVEADGGGYGDEFGDAHTWEDALALQQERLHDFGTSL